ncbi:hypothetical protein SAMN05428997_10499 [Bosea sp. CRIB-10]|uniref:hypothetical protein n=1 Tax=Bosea sp. CRIB-10 TaxID=378404 RepID=UPI0008F3C4A4|nr:hypothetical protein [Bosea sp. CRIB-10]SFC10962.1 hypothetical protein SAMN05428997_10499 [Bosea sp. CRIB-10]
MSWRKAWGKRPRLASADLRNVAPWRDYIAIRFRASQLLDLNPFSGGKRGQRHRTDVQTHLNNAQALRIADLYTLVKALNEVRKAGASPNRPVKAIDVDELLRSVFLGPSSWQTLLKQGQVLARQRDEAFGYAHRAYLTPALASRLSASGHQAALADLIASETLAIDLIGRGLMAAQAHTSGLRNVFKQLWRRRRPRDETISQDVIDSVPRFSVGEMASLSFASAVNASLIWNDHFGDTTKVGYFYLHEFAIFAGRLARGEPAQLTEELAQYIQAERLSAGADDVARREAYMNIMPAHHAFLAIWDQIVTVYDRATFSGEVRECIMTGEARTLRIRGFSA